jgi:transglutaminase-like putative cysteine protease
MKVAVRHLTRLVYSTSVSDAVMEVRLGPYSDSDQRWERLDLRVRPNGAVRGFVDGFGNQAQLITVARGHDTLEVESLAEVWTLLADPFAPPPRPPAPLSPMDRVDYLSASKLIPIEPPLEAMAAKFRSACPNSHFDCAHELMEAVYRELQYVQNVTNVSTTVTEVLEAREGVCQDFAHVMIGLCRTLGIPARYVSGYLVLDDQAAPTPIRPDPNAERAAQVAAASHAWAEVYTSTHGWRGFDPTNNLLASEHHVKMAIGRDYGDIPPTRGTYRGGADERMYVEVSTQRLD